MKKWSTACKAKIIEPEHIERVVSDLRTHQQTIATLNGSFDLLHAGHLQILYEASQLADVLIVALNSDSSIQQYKSPDRPIIPLESRLQMMAALECVDFVTWFHETTPIALLARIQPDVHVNGAEYGLECIEASTVKAHGGRIHIVELVPGLSTSAIIQKIRTLDQPASSSISSNAAAAQKGSEAETDNKGIATAEETSAANKALQPVESLDKIKPIADKAKV